MYDVGRKAVKINTNDIMCSRALTPSVEHSDVNMNVNSSRRFLNVYFSGFILTDENRSHNRNVT